VLAGAGLLGGEVVGGEKAEPSMVCSKALKRSSDSRVSEKWENIEESESDDARRGRVSSSVYKGAEKVGIGGLDAVVSGEKDG